MTFKTKKLVLWLLAIVFILALVFFKSFLLETTLGASLSMIFVVAFLILNFAWWRCDHCGRYLGKLSVFAKHCPFCGKELE